VGATWPLADGKRRDRGPKPGQSQPVEDHVVVETPRRIEADARLHRKFTMNHEWVETVDEDERFLPLIQGEASQICDHLWLGSEDNVRDLVWLKVNKITRIVTIMPRAIYPTDSGQMSEALKFWFAENVETLFLEALDTPTQLVFNHMRRAIKFIDRNMKEKKAVLVHCGRGISRSATLIIAMLMVRNKTSYVDA